MTHRWCGRRPRGSATARHQRPGGARRGAPGHHRCRLGPVVAAARHRLAPDQGGQLARDLGLAALAGRPTRSAVLPSAESLPPPTMFPLVPTFARPRAVRRPPRTARTGPAPRAWSSRRPTSGRARASRCSGSQHVETTIGSDPGCDVVLPGLEPHHASVLHTDADEYVLTNLGPETRVHGAVVTGLGDAPHRRARRPRRALAGLRPRGVRRPRPPLRWPDRWRSRPSAAPTPAPGSRPGVSGSLTAFPAPRSCPTHALHPTQQDRSPMRVLVTGATGYVGSRLIPDLLSTATRCTPRSAARVRPTSTPGATR